MAKTIKLPFVRKENFWSVTPSGDYEADCETGDTYARAFLAMAGEYPPLLGYIVNDMRRVERSGIEIGFLHRIAERVLAA